MIDHNNLEEFADPHNYDIEDNSDTGIAFYTALAQETGNPVLEIACGTGRFIIPIAQLGPRLRPPDAARHYGVPTQNMGKRNQQTCQPNVLSPISPGHKSEICPKTLAW